MPTPHKPKATNPLTRLMPEQDRYQYETGILRTA